MRDPSVWVGMATALVMALAVGCAPATCGVSGGIWTECGSGCGPLGCGETSDPNRDCPDVCLPQCECPSDAPYWHDERGCLTDEQCEEIAG